MYKHEIFSNQLAKLFASMTIWYKKVWLLMCITT